VSDEIVNLYPTRIRLPWAIGCPLCDNITGEFPMRESLLYPVKVVVLGLKLSDRRCGVRGHELFFSLCIYDGDLQVPIGPLRNILLKLVHDLNVLVRQFK